jgi:hypothetical protein
MDPAVDGYLRRLTGGLVGPGRRRHAIVAEIADGLAEAADRWHARGLDRRAAARAAVAEFGDPLDLARMFNAEQAGVAAHRTGLGLALTGPLVGTVWLGASAAGTGLGWFEQLGVLLSASPALVVALAVGAPAAALAALAGSGRIPVLSRVPVRRVTGLAALAACAAVAGDGVLLAGTLSAPGPLWTLSGPIAAATAVSLVRLITAGLAARRCLRLRAAC